MHFWSRSREELWHKGETSGNVHAPARAALRLRRRRAAGARRAGRPACHTGERTCFHDGELEPPAPHEALPALERTIAERARRARRRARYTAELLADPPRIGEKVREEAEEVARAAARESDERVAEEAADVLYHLEVLLARAG